MGYWILEIQNKVKSIFQKSVEAVVICRLQACLVTAPKKYLTKIRTFAHLRTVSRIGATWSISFNRLMTSNQYNNFSLAILFTLSRRSLSQGALERWSAQKIQLYDKCDGTHSLIFSLISGTSAFRHVEVVKLQILKQSFVDMVCKHLSMR